MKTKIIQLFLPLIATLPLAACQYSNEFHGTFNQEAAVLKAFSKNTDRYCIALTLTSNAEVRTSSISAHSVFDPNDFSRPKSFNTKNEPCTQNLPEYLVGTRSSQVIGTSLSIHPEALGGNLCHDVFYSQYRYQDQIELEFKNELSDLTTGKFTGTGEIQTYTDFSRPVNFGPIYRCNSGYPHPFPHFVP
jgi:hypothetical protein